MRFIPTHVGNTCHDKTAEKVSPVHPHTRGEHIYPIFMENVGHGSSPHTWGTHNHSHYSLLDGRFIPTHVGNTRMPRLGHSAASVHPHTRGEHNAISGVALNNLGSSPHTWGTHGRRDHGPGERRFIPTHVGNTRCGPESPRCNSVHPHTRGEHGEFNHQCASFAGSSPHTWGTPKEYDAALSDSRFIPTHVGNT